MALSSPSRHIGAPRLPPLSARLGWPGTGVIAHTRRTPLPSRRRRATACALRVHARAQRASRHSACAGAAIQFHPARNGHARLAAYTIFAAPRRCVRRAAAQYAAASANALFLSSTSLHSTTLPLPLFHRPEYAIIYYSARRGVAAGWRGWTDAIVCHYLLLRVLFSRHYAIARHCHIIAAVLPRRTARRGAA